MNYSIFIREQIVPKFHGAHGAGGGIEAVLNYGEAANYPATFQDKIYSDISDLYGADQSKRVEIWSDPEGKATSEEIFVACPEIRKWKEQCIRTVGAFKLTQLATPYEAPERETWPYQRAEALAWQIDKSTATPYCDIIAAGRGVPRELFIPKVLENSTLFAQASAQLLGLQQSIIDRLWSEQDFNSFMAIEWPS